MSQLTQNSAIIGPILARYKIVCWECTTTNKVMTNQKCKL